jgi:hypothetical protein
MRRASPSTTVYQPAIRWATLHALSLGDIIGQRFWVMNAAQFGSSVMSRWLEIATRWVYWPR